jgi:hypothetical protein
VFERYAGSGGILLYKWKVDKWKIEIIVLVVSFLIDPQCQFPGEGQNM